MKVSAVRADYFMGRVGQTDRHDGPNSRFSEFCERISKKEIKERQVKEMKKAFRE